MEGTIEDDEVMAVPLRLCSQGGCIFYTADTHPSFVFLSLTRPPLRTQCLAVLRRRSGRGDLQFSCPFEF